MAFNFEKVVSLFQMLLADGTQYLSVKNGSMLFDRKVTVTSPCMTDPFRYPFDSGKVL